MSIIGRLDEQVDAVLIAPLKRRDAPEATPTETNKRMETAASQPHRDARQDETGARREAKRDLPVWLL